MDNLTIDLLINHPEAIPEMVRIWQRELGQIWMPEVTISEVESWYSEELDRSTVLPITYLVFVDGTVIGECSLRESDDVWADLTPWLSPVIVSTEYQRRGIGKQLVEKIKLEAHRLEYQHLYLYTFDPDLINYYNRHGFYKIAMDESHGHTVTVMKADL